MELESRNFQKAKRGGRWGFEGLRLKSDEEIQEANAAENATANEPDENTDIFNQVKETA